MSENEPSKLDWNLNYGELSSDVEFVNNCENLVQSLKGVQNLLNQLLPLKRQYDKLSTPAKIELDLILAFTLNSLHWINLRIQGIDPVNHPVKGELQRIKAAMLRWQQVKDRDKRPRMDKEAAKRFVKSGLYDSSNSSNQQNKKMKFDENSQ